MKCPRCQHENSPDHAEVHNTKQHRKISSREKRGHSRWTQTPMKARGHGGSFAVMLYCQ